MRQKLTPSSVEKAKGLGWIVSLTDICAKDDPIEQAPVPPPPVTPPPPPPVTPPILSAQHKNIDDWHNHQLILPSWFSK